MCVLLHERAVPQITMKVFETFKEELIKERLMHSLNGSGQVLTGPALTSRKDSRKIAEMLWLGFRTRTRRLGVREKARRKKLMQRLSIIKNIKSFSWKVHEERSQEVFVDWRGSCEDLEGKAPGILRRND